MKDFSVNTNINTPVQKLIDIASSNAHLVVEYPDSTNVSILKLVSSFLCVPKDNIGIGIGSTQILFQLPNLLEYKRAIVPVPTFWEYTTFNRLFDKEIKKIFLNANENFHINNANLQKEIEPSDCVFLCNINNPTSILYRKTDVLELVRNNPETHFVVDETYLLFREDFTNQSLTKEAARYDNLHVVLSFSKFFSIPGIRFGVIVSDRDTVKKYTEKFHIPYSVNPLTEILLNNTLNDTEFIHNSRKFYRTEGVVFFNKLSRILKGRLRCYKPDGCFILAKILTNQNSRYIKDTLRKEGCMIRGGHELTDLDETWLRFSIRSDEDNTLLLSKLDLLLQ
ncbi:TPA: hypothetical protein DEW47_03695 [Patescibacteria group bacterium]|nr:MAG: Histidinol-phosphate transaminase [Parcubacteria group bacterium GW2011_GWF2_40_10]KKR46708.1 MAG: Histidinol-phosphate transaminase [Parcubacteria group bacterium GW2011_GWA2_40_143]KKR59392.1 MAG: Histidinol-phosphate transaminase [Parcubacteria group bacterium GW2011_GWC2_40_31]KKR74435.1 MAG: Histidinol-phosphate transaminase [Parcubacteria group bacterium GW2011_GWB2_40_8]KKR75966.1 MAG: Histidinol-phosphate transaminase [Parcubacteria group bacterium GW2011_GWE2_40_8]KKR82219.1 M